MFYDFLSSFPRRKIFIYQSNCALGKQNYPELSGIFGRCSELTLIPRNRADSQCDSLVRMETESVQVLNKIANQIQLIKA